ncbi:MAG: response regulator, partial [Spirochaetales bacterium]
MYRVLIAEDERLEREALQFELRRMTDLVSEVSVVANGRQAIDEATANPPDIAVLDIRMPGITGIEAARSIKQAHPDCHIIFLTAFNYFDYAREAIRLHADDFLIKPVSNARLEQVIRETAARLAEEGVRDRTPRAMGDERALAESKLIGDAVLGQIDERAIRGYLGLGVEHVPEITAIVIRVTPKVETFAPEGADHERLLKRRVLSLLRYECDQVQVGLIASAEASSIYALTVETVRHASGTNGAAARAVGAAVAAAERHLGVTIVVGHDGPAPGFARIGLRLANAKVASRQQAPDSPATLAGSRREVLHAEQALVRAVAGETDAAIESAVQDLVSSISTIVRDNEQLGVELEDAMTYVAHATAMQVGSFPEEVGNLINALAGRPTPAAPRELLLDVAAIARNLASHLATVKASTHWAVTAAREYIDQNFSRDLTLDAIANEVRLSPFYLSRVFKASSQMTVLDYLTKRRVEHAQTLMAGGRLSIKEISAAVGYS